MAVLRITLLWLFCLPLWAASFGPADFAKRDWLAIVAAYEPEMAAIDKALASSPDASISATQTFRGVRYQLAHYKGKKLLIFASGVSVTNAAMTMQMALDYFPVGQVVMMGIAGGVNPKFHPGDIAVPARWYYHDEAVYANPDPAHKGQYLLPDYYQAELKKWQQLAKSDPNRPHYQPFGFIFPNEVKVIKDGWQQRQPMPYFSADSQLLAAVKAAASAVTIKMPSGRKVQVSVGGNGVTGSVFLDNSRYRQWLRRVYRADVTEMESAALAQVCFVNNVPWVVIRSVSDLAGGQQGKNTENVFDAIASGTAAELLLAMLDKLS
ncbi:5'-methylthioadenosine/S-adenosylhomocysteine nucleosidase family protein [Gallaecimonas mangrovi]|uniref:5'-methylthioadenosine/S-adenosylhomocysteine nucleosidase family protein n=1 Tax=Gallaecimonas mangrovi TaxID=2291597 RepID=UPI000E20B9A9|nr:5'-methylthioadenosine/S-adenosylhomocysteine nucleosidase [Gallaecimonas mangrovi]